MINKKMKYSFFGGLLIILIAIFVYSLSLPVTRCFFIKNADFVKIDQNLFCSPDSDQLQRNKLKVYVKQAQSRNNLFWNDSIKENFTVIFCSSKAELNKYTGNENFHAISHITPMGAYIVIDSVGLNVDILSHEINHSVFAGTIGYRAYSKLPVWFTEGVALQVDYRDIMTDSVLQMNYTTNNDYLNSISENKTFHHSDWEITRTHYLNSKYDVEKWINIYGMEKFHFLVDNLKDGEEFNECFKTGKIVFLNN